MNLIIKEVLSTKEKSFNYSGVAQISLMLIYSSCPVSDPNLQSVLKEFLLYGALSQNTAL
jgi:hypothetical protein